QHT
ncbi:glnD PII-uridylyltransferase family protein, partial [Vibrio parahaemolyticus V-223/04]